MSDYLFVAVVNVSDYLFVAVVNVSDYLFAAVVNVSDYLFVAVVNVSDYLFVAVVNVSDYLLGAVVAPAASSPLLSLRICKCSTPWPTSPVSEASNGPQTHAFVYALCESWRKKKQKLC